MKIKRKKPKFEPVRVILENQEEAEAFFELLLCSSPQTEEQWKVMRWVENLDWEMLPRGG